ncbi:DUF4349 domain-containing protein [Paenibacillus sp. MWE-103]|uniref:DUF4349 domain-containing protein n=1 Tax=Paenibacillus artemisiicola TaxID=1172618 RepID=A0ABS3W6E3_9BACL|nr:DUF4349 domain-containing protein [Paenibacillus artemisiicola]MBO7743870.1 DUF4349 domain-containing protein [Paenibacillus artemisiicola]
MRRTRAKWWAGLLAMAVLAGMLAGCSAANRNASNGASADSAAAADAGNADAGSDDKATSESADSSATADTMASTSAAAEAPPESADPSGSGAQPGGSEDGTAGNGAAGEPIDRKIVYRGNVTMEVKAYDEAQTKLRDLIHLSGGYLLKFADQKTSAERGGTFTIKVPATGFDGFLAGLEKIEHLEYQSSAQGTDVTQEYVDLGARLKARQVVEARLLDFMAKATKTADLLQISQQLGDVQTEIEQIKGRIRYLDANVAYSTIDLRMYETVEAVAAANPAKRGFGERISDAAESSAKALYAAAQGVVVFAAGALPVAAAIAIIAVPCYAFYRSGRRKAAGRAAARANGTPGPAGKLPETPEVLEVTKPDGGEERSP